MVRKIFNFSHHPLEKKRVLPPAYLSLPICPSSILRMFSLRELLISVLRSLCMWDNSRSPGIAIIIPARNEAKNLQYVLPYIPTDIREVILVDGHSTDDTIEVARRLLPSIQIVRQEGRGKGNALRQGFAASSADIIVTLDADGSADPREIPRFVHALMHGHDFAKGSRFMNGGRSFDITFFRRLGNACL